MTLWHRLLCVLGLRFREDPPGYFKAMQRFAAIPNEQIRRGAV